MAAKIIAAVLAFQLGLAPCAANITTYSNSADTAAVQTDIAQSVIGHRYADKAEGIAYFEKNDTYYNNLSQRDLNWRMKKIGANAEELREYAKKQVMDFTDEEKQYIDSRLARISQRFDEIGFKYPLDKDIVLVKTTMSEEMDAGGYTFENYIFLGESLIDDYLDAGEDYAYLMDEVLAHEICHVLTRNDRDFRAKLYRSIGFELGDEPEFSDEVKTKILSNPDVEKYDCYSYFTVDGKKKKGTVVSVFDEDYKEGEYAFKYMVPYVVFYDEPDKIYPISEISDFYDVFGKNTEYIIAAEECLADNFSFAVVYGDKANYSSPEIIKYILKVMSE